VHRVVLDADGMAGGIFTAGYGFNGVLNTSMVVINSTLSQNRAGSALFLLSSVVHKWAL
jgi:hypothetical protein